MTTITIPGNVYNALRLCGGKDDVRYYLNGILIDFANEQLVATDGHRLLKVPIDVEHPGTEIADDLPDTIVAMTSRKADREGSIVLTIDAAGVDSATATAFSKTGKQKWSEVVDVIDGTFPDYKKVIPPWGEGPRDQVPLVTYNPTLIGEVAAALSPGGFPCRVVPSDSKGTGALLVQLDGYPDATLVLAPMRASWS